MFLFLTKNLGHDSLLYSSHMKNVDTLPGELDSKSGQKKRWLSLAIIVLLILSIGGNIFQAAWFLMQNRLSIQQEDSQVTTDVIEPVSSPDLTYTLTTPNGFTWIVRPVEGTDVRNSQYELVSIGKEGTETVKEIFQFMPDFGNISLGLNSAGAIELQYAMSPGEAYYRITKILFTSDGNESFRVSYRTDSDFVNFNGLATPEYVASLVTSGTCPNETTIQDGVTFSPGKVELLGVKVTSSEGEQMFNLDEPQSVDCGVAYGDNIVDPMITDVNIESGTISFSLPNGGHAWVTLAIDGVDVNFY